MGGDGGPPQREAARVRAAPGGASPYFPFFSRIFCFLRTTFFMSPEAWRNRLFSLAFRDACNRAVVPFAMCCSFA